MTSSNSNKNKRKPSLGKHETKIEKDDGTKKKQKSENKIEQSKVMPEMELGLVKCFNCQEPIKRGYETFIGPEITKLYVPVANTSKLQEEKEKHTPWCGYCIMQVLIKKCEICKLFALGCQDAQGHLHCPSCIESGWKYCRGDCDGTSKLLGHSYWCGYCARKFKVCNGTCDRCGNKIRELFKYNGNYLCGGCAPSEITIQWYIEHGKECGLAHDTMYKPVSEKKGRLCDDCHARYIKCHRCDCDRCGAEQTPI